MSKSKIDWTDETINPFTGCNGPNRKRCPFCYAEKMAKRLTHMPGGEKYRMVAEHSGGDPFAPAFHFNVAQQEGGRLKRARKPRRVFIGSMGEICFNGRANAFDSVGGNYGTVDSKLVQRIVAAFCADLPQHTFQILTKRPDLLSHELEWPSNVHLGVSLSGNGDSHRIATLLGKTAVGTGSQGGGRWHPQMVLWASVEPLLDMDFDPWRLRGLGWVVIGAETGGRKGVATEILYAAIEIVERCASLGIPCFVKDNMRKADPNYDWPREFPKHIT